jgi:preprotein translocase SecE subunit
LTVCFEAGYLIWESNTLATKEKKSATKKVASTTKVTRIKASTTVDAAVKKETKPIEKVTKKQSSDEKGIRNPLKPLVSIAGYFAGAWYELKQVRWPNRRATWGMTAAMLGFTAFFVVLVLLLDALFKYLFDIILG